MSSEARVALNRLMAALEHHFDMAKNADVVSSAMLEDAELRLQDAFFTYDDVLFTSLGIELPLELIDDYGDDDEDDDDDDHEEDDDDDDFEKYFRNVEEEDSVAGLLDEN